MGGWRVQGRSDSQAEQLMADALAVQDAGAFAIVLEMVPGELATELTAVLGIPTIGIGAGVDCDGQVLVCNDLLGFDLSFSPRFVKRFAELQEPMIGAIQSYVDEVRSGTFPADEHTFHREKKARKVTRLY